MSGGANDFMQVLQSVAKPGSLVDRGQVVAEFDRQYQLLRLDDYRASVEQSDRTLRSLDANIEVQRKSYDQAIEQAKAAVEKAKLDIKTTPVRSKIEAELLQLALEEAQAQLKQLQSQIPYQNTSLNSQRRVSEIEVEQSRNELKRAERNVGLMEIKAGIGGMLVMENMMRGSEFAAIQQGDQLFPGQMFARIVDTSSMLVMATVNQADVESLRVNAKAMLHFDAYPGLELPAHVMSIAAIPRPGGQRGSFVKELSVYLKIDRMDPRVIPDLSVSVDVVVETGENQVMAPLEAVFQQGAGNKSYVYVKAGDGFEKREVVVGLRNNVSAAIQSGLKAGEVIALEMPVKPVEPAENRAAADFRRRGSQRPVGVMHVV